jgi:hypothetical protein
MIITPIIISKKKKIIKLIKKIIFHKNFRDYILILKSWLKIISKDQKIIF